MSIVRDGHLFIFDDTDFSSSLDPPSMCSMTGLGYSGSAYFFCDSSLNWLKTLLLDDALFAEIDLNLV